MTRRALQLLALLVMALAFGALVATPEPASPHPRCIAHPDVRPCTPPLFDK